MASVRVQEEIVKVIQEEKYVITLNREEASTLAAILRRVGGSSQDTFRGDAESVLNVLRVVPGLYDEAIEKGNSLAGRLVFFSDTAPLTEGNKKMLKN